MASQQGNRFAISVDRATIDSRTSTMSTVQDLNSASSLSWADDEVENMATLQVHQFLNQLDDYLSSGTIPSRTCFNLAEAEQWREMIESLKLTKKFKESRKFHTIPDEIHQDQKMKKLEITGYSLVQVAPVRYGSQQSNADLVTHRARSAYPPKASSSMKPTASARMSATRSSYGNSRLHSSKTKDIHSILNDTARLSLHRESTKNLPQVNPSTGLKRMKLQPNSIPKLEAMYESGLPPLTGSPPKSRVPFRNQTASQINNPHKSAMAYHPKQPSEDDHFVQKPTSAALHRNHPTNKFGLLYRNMYANGHHINPQYRNDLSDIEVGVVGTSFDPIVRPIRITNKISNLRSSM